MDVREYEVGKILQLRREVDNETDLYAVAAVQEDRVVGHMPFIFAKPISLFLQREFNDSRVEITAEKINQGAGHGLKLPSVYRLYGPKLYIDKLKDLMYDIMAGTSVYCSLEVVYYWKCPLMEFSMYHLWYFS